MCNSSPKSLGHVRYAMHQSCPQQMLTFLVQVITSCVIVAHLVLWNLFLIELVRVTLCWRNTVLGVEAFPASDTIQLSSHHVKQPTLSACWQEISMTAFLLVTVNSKMRLLQFALAKSRTNGFRDIRKRQLSNTCVNIIRMLGCAQGA